MMSTSASNLHRAPHRASDIFVLAAMTLVVCALGAGLYLQLGLSAWLAMAAALGVYTVFIGLHASVRRLTKHQQTKLQGSHDARGRASVGHTVEAAVRHHEKVVDEPKLAGASTLEKPTDSERQPSVKSHRRSLRSPVATKNSATNQDAARALKRDTRGETKPLPIAGPTPGSDDLSGYWAFRPKDSQLDVSISVDAGKRSEPQDGRPAAVAPVATGSPISNSAPVRHDAVPGAVPASSEVPTAPTMTAKSIAGKHAASKPMSSEIEDMMESAFSAIRQADVERVQERVKNLADRVNAIEIASGEGRSTATEQSTERAIELSLEVLRATADTMRTARAEKPMPVGPINSVGNDVSSVEMKKPVPPAPPVDPRALYIEAISAKRFEGLVEPIVALQERKIRHYMFMLALKSAAGERLPVSPPASLKRSGQLPILDGLRLAHAVQLVRNLVAREKSGLVFLEMTSELLLSERVQSELALLTGTTAQRLVVCFTQTDVRAFTTRDWDLLRELRKTGLGFGICEVREFDMNLDALKSWGFGFVKLDGAALVDGLPSPRGNVSALDMCRAFTTAGLMLVAGELANEAAMERAVAAGASLGQGALFGPPRALKTETPKAQAASVAA